MKDRYKPETTQIQRAEILCAAEGRANDLIRAVLRDLDKAEERIRQLETMLLLQVKQ